MSNRITRVEVRNRSLTPTEADVWITVHAETLTATTEIRGRLMGPSCPYSTTIEAAYPLRALSHPPANVPPLTGRVVIPEPSLWDPVSPFLYHGFVELWQDGERCDRVTIRHGLGSSQLTPRGLRCNGKTLWLQGRRVSGLSDDNALSLRHAGCNLLFASLDEPETWERADRLGFLVLGELKQRDDAGKSAALTSHPSCLGWLLDGPEMVVPAERVGVVASERGTIPSWASFLVCESEQVAPFTSSNLPILVRGTSATPSPPVVGCIS